MPRIRSSVFGAMQPKISTELLADSQGQQAQNMTMRSGSFDPMRAPLAVAGVTLGGTGTTATIYRFGQDIDSATQYWFRFSSDVNVVRGPVANDTEERTYLTDGVYPKKTKSDIALASTPYPSSTLRMGVPMPGWAGEGVTPTYTPSAVVSGTATDSTVTATNSTYVVTYVTSWGEEGPPSLASSVYTWRPGQTVTVTLPGNLSGAYDITKVRLYRSATGASSRTSFQLVDEKPVATATYADTKLQSALQETLTTWDFDPPLDQMVGLIDCGNGFMAGFYKSTLYFSEPNFPYAWPAKYELPASGHIVGLAAFGQSIFVGHTRGVDIVGGVDPAAVSMENIKDAQACVSKRSIVAMLGGVLYAGPDGLGYVGPGGYRNLTDKVLTREQWQSYSPASIHAYEHEGRYIAFYDNGTTQASLLFTFGDEASFVTCTEYCTAAFNDRRRDALYVVQAETLKQWDAGTAMTASWRSKNYRLPSGLSFSRGVVLADAYPITFTYYVDGVAQGPYSITSAAPFPLPPVWGRVVSYAISGAARVHQAAVATSAKEIGE